MNFIPYGRQDITEDDLNEVLTVLKSDWITQGPTIKKFEESLQDYTGGKKAFAVNSATSALHIACRALDVKEGDIVWTSPITFVASSNAALYCGADIDFVDIDPNTFNLCPKLLEEKLRKAKQDNKLPKVIIPVHMTGQSCHMKEIKKLAEEYDFKIIEDASHAIGGSYYSKPVGSCEFSDITVFSFHPVKIVTTGEGGACLTNNEILAEKLELLRSHGVTRKDELIGDKDQGQWYYEQVELGYNYRITDIQAALGLSQMNRLDGYIEKRHVIAKRYRELLNNDRITLPEQSDGIRNSFHLFIVRVPKEIRKNVFDKLRNSGIGVNVHYFPVHLQPYYKKLGFEKGMFPNAENYYEECISLPMFPTLTDSQQEYVCEKLLEFVNESTCNNNC